LTSLGITRTSSIFVTNTGLGFSNPSEKSPFRAPTAALIEKF
jgi:hypothetical protein